MLPFEEFGDNNFSYEKLSLCSKALRCELVNIHFSFESTGQPSGHWKIGCPWNWTHKKMISAE